MLTRDLCTGFLLKLLLGSYMASSFNPSLLCSVLFFLKGLPSLLCLKWCFLPHSQNQISQCLIFTFIYIFFHLLEYKLLCSILSGVSDYIIMLNKYLLNAIRGGNNEKDGINKGCLAFLEKLGKFLL